MATITFAPTGYSYTRPPAPTQPQPYLYQAPAQAPTRAGAVQRLISSNTAGPSWMRSLIKAPQLQQLQTLAGALPAPKAVAASTPSTLGDFRGDMSPDDVRALVNQYITAGGAQNIDNGQYWVDRWAEWGQRDPGYFLTRLKQGIAGQPGYNQTWGNIESRPAEDGTGSNQNPVSGYAPQFDDPSTKLLEQSLINAIAQLNKPAYTGQEAEVLRTRAFEPIEADRRAALERSLRHTSQSGYLPSSGVALDLENQINAGYDMARAQSQNQLAYSQIAEERSRQQEALSLISLLQQLPSMAQQQALAAIGLAPSPESMVNQLLGLFQIGQQQRQQGAGSYEAIGAMLPYLTRAFQGGTDYSQRPGSWPWDLTQ